MKRIVLLFFVFLLPFTVFAKDTCDTDSIKIDSITLEDISGNIEEVREASVNGLKINLGLKMNVVGDSAEYKIILNNTSDNDFYLNKDLIKVDSDYLNYDVVIDNSTNLIKSGEKKTVFLKIIYKNKVPSARFHNGILNESNTITLRLADDEKAFSLLSNPNTGNLFIVYLILLLIILVIALKNKKKNQLMILIGVSIILPITGYALCMFNIDVESNIEIRDRETLSGILFDSSGNSCFMKYEGQVTDELGKTVDATNVYYDTCVEKRNVIFANMCWQVVRTNETKGIRMIYNGNPVDGKCENNRDNHKGIVGKNGTTMTMSSPYLYSSSYTYNLEDQTFTLSNPSVNTWSDDTYETILGKYTCLDDTSYSCTTLYHVNGYSSNTKAYYTSYTIEDTNYAEVGKSPYNLNVLTLNMVGYMFNKTYNIKMKNMSTTDYMYGHSYQYNEETDTYTLSGETKIIGDWETGYDKLANTHYTCWNTTGECKKLSYVFFTSITSYGSDYKEAIYVELTKGLTVDDILSDWFTGEDINKYDSTAKSFLENWYQNNLVLYSNYIEDSVYCNNIDIDNYGGWLSDGQTIDSNRFSFALSHNRYDLSCDKKIYQFTMTNAKAKLKYPINLLSFTDYYNLTKDNKELVATGSIFMVSPHLFVVGDNGQGVSIATLWYYPVSVMANGVRPVISLKPSVMIESGSGSERDPWIIK